MSASPKSSPGSAEQRRNAEERLRKQAVETAPARSVAENQRLVHELQVHQIELEMQNEELQRARDEMEAGLEKYSDLYDFAPVGYVTLDCEGTIREANLTCASLLGVERSRLLKRRFGLYVAIADLRAFSDFHKRVFAGQGREFCEVTILKQGKDPVEVRIEAALAASGRECRAVVTDITERKRAELDRLILGKLESTGTLASGLAHDFNNLLTVILLNLELARTLGPPGKELAQLLEEAMNTGLAARNLTQQLIIFARGGAPIRTPARLTGVIEESTRSALAGSKLQCEFALAEDLWPAAVDSGQIGQLIRNLVVNAREAMPDGGRVSVRAKNVVLSEGENPALPAGEYVQLSVTDRGAGIPKEVLPKIFDPYFSTKQRGDQKGMGLGLTICHAVVQKHEGAIAVTSSAGSGTTFQVHLPASLVQSGEKPATSSAPSIPLRAKILVMDDEEAVRKVVGTSLQRLGHEVELVADGQQALAAYENARGRGVPFDAVLLDLTIPGGMGGKETVLALRRLDPRVKAIVMSGYTDDQVMHELEQHGFLGALPKPFNRDHLQKVVAQILAPGVRAGGPIRNSS